MNLRGVILAWLTAIALASFLPGADTPSPAWESAYRARLQGWSLQPLHPRPVPPVQHPAWVRNLVDSFILSRLEQQGIKPSAAADRSTLARRLSFALTGLPPSPSTLDSFLHDESPRSLESLIQSLMASPHFGEHWAGHWMDVVHYSDPLTHSNNAPWDQHGELKLRHEENARITDQPVSALVADLRARGLLDQTLVVWAGEMGRTPHSSGRDGRDHHASGYTIWMTGGGIRGGMTYGATDEMGMSAVENPVNIHDIHATILHQLSLDHKPLTYRFGGRDMRLTDVHGQVIREILT